MPEAPDDMIVDHAAGLHVGVDDHRTEELETALFQVLGIGHGDLGLGRDVTSLALGLQGLALHESPLIPGEAAELLLDFQEPAGVVERGFQFEPIAHDTRVFQPDLHLLGAEPGQVGRVEAGVGLAIGFALAQNGDPAESGLGRFQSEEFKQANVIPDRHPPFLIMIGLVEWVGAAPSATRFFHGDGFSTPFPGTLPGACALINKRRNEVTLLATVPESWWLYFNGAVLLMLVLDLAVVHRQNKDVSIKDALFWTAVWVSLALGLNVFLAHRLGEEAGLQFLTGYLIEKSLSVDNLFVFLLIFRYFKVPGEYQHKVLFWGVLGALFMRAGMIFAGVSLLDNFDWLTYLFGFMLLYTAWKMFKGSDSLDPTSSKPFQWIQKNLPYLDKCGQGRFFLKKNGVWMASRLLLVLVCVEISDIIFAVDSIPAILAVTRDPFLIYSSNVMALLGLRSLYFALAGGLESFRYLDEGMAGVLGFVGIKMLLSDLVHIPTPLSLGVVVCILAVAIGLSLQYPEQAEGAA
jgi:tellurite resistance protein TerC